MDTTFYVYTHIREDTGVVFYVGKGSRTNKKQYTRAYVSKKRNQYWKRIAAKTKYTVELIADFFSENDAFDFEKKLIAFYKRQCDGGTLCNLTEGGEGHAGLSPSAETRKKMSESAKGKRRTKAQRLAVSLAQRGVPNPPEQIAAHSIRMSGKNNPNYGKKNSAETLAKKSASMKGKLAGEKHPFFGKKRPKWHVDQYSGGKAGRARAVIDVQTGKVYDCIKYAAEEYGVTLATMSRWLNKKRKNPTNMRFA